MLTHVVVWFSLCYLASLNLHLVPPYASATLVLFLFLIYALLISTLELLLFLFPLLKFFLSFLFAWLSSHFSCVVQMSSYPRPFFALFNRDHLLLDFLNPIIVLIIIGISLLYWFLFFSYVFMNVWVCVFLLPQNVFNITKCITLFPDLLQCLDWINCWYM